MSQKSKKLEGVVKQITAALAAGVKVLNEVSDNTYQGSLMDEKPQEHAGLILFTLNNAIAELKEQAKYEGKTDTEIEDLKAAEELTERAGIQDLVAQKMAEYEERKKPKPAEVPQPADQTASEVVNA